MTSLFLKHKMRTFTKFQTGYSLKNIPIPSKLEYQRALTTEVEKFLVRCRWKHFFFKNPDGRGKEINTFGFKSTKYPKTDKDLRDFENDLMEMISSVETRYHTNPLLNTMKEDKRKIQSSPYIIISADKTGNLYEMEPDVYRKFLRDNITKDYKKARQDTVEKINEAAANIAAKMELDERIDAMAMNRAFLTVKDHKTSFPSKPDFRLINPSKSEMGKISKKLLGKVCKNLKEQLMVNQWRSTGEVLDWFAGLENKKELRFVKFDIECFYPSITMRLLKMAIDLARKHTTVTEEEEKIILHSRRAVLTDNVGQVWTKKENPDFDVTMGAFDGAEVCELVGLFILSMIKTILETKFFGIYRDDGLAVVKCTGQLAERIKKKLHTLFKQVDLKITAEANLTEVNFLDVIFNLDDGSFRPYTKPNCQVKYVSKQSNHPPLIVNNIPTSINRRLATIASSKECFEEEIEVYQDALKQAGHDHQLEYFEVDRSSGEGDKKRKGRKKKIIWFNPPYSCTIKTNIGKKFFGILQKHFPQSHELSRLFNKKNVKLSYSCMPAMKSIISAHNKKILAANFEEEEAGCNCRGGESSCPLAGKCQTQSLVYKAELDSTEGEVEYIGQTNVTFKVRWNNHKTDFRHQKKEKSTTLSKYVWHLKRKEVDYSLSWSTACLATPYSRETKSCQLCTMEKTLIALQDRGKALNKRYEIMTRCWHRDKHVLSNWASLHPHLLHEEDDHLPLPPEDQPGDLTLSPEENGQHQEHLPDQDHLPLDGHQDDHQDDPHTQPLTAPIPYPLNSSAPRVRQPGGRGRRQQQVPPLHTHQPGDLGPPAPDPGDEGGGAVPDTGGGGRMEVVVLSLIREEERMGGGDLSQEAKGEKIVDT